LPKDIKDIKDIKGAAQNLEYLRLFNCFLKGAEDTLNTKEKALFLSDK